MKEQIEYFQCRYCGAVIKLDQSKYDEKGIVYPFYCEENQGGCGRKSKFVKLSKEWVEERKLQKEK